MRDETETRSALDRRCEYGSYLKQLAGICSLLEAAGKACEADVALDAELSAIRGAAMAAGALQTAMTRSADLLEQELIDGR